MSPEFEPGQQSIINWIVSALGPVYMTLLPLAALTSLVLTLIVVVRGKGPMAGVALLFIVPAPLLIGLFAALQGGMNSYSVIATGSATPKPSDIAVGISTALVAPLIGMLLMVPSYALAAFGSLIRSFSGEPSRSQQG